MRDPLQIRLRERDPELSQYAVDIVIGRNDHCSCIRSPTADYRPSEDPPATRARHLRRHRLHGCRRAYAWAMAAGSGDQIPVVVASGAPAVDATELGITRRPRSRRRVVAQVRFGLFLVL